MVFLKSELEKLQDMNTKLELLLAGKKAQVRVDVAEGNISINQAVAQDHETDTMIDDIKNMLDSRVGFII